MMLKPHDVVTCACTLTYEELTCADAPRRVSCKLHDMSTRLSHASTSSHNRQLTIHAGYSLSSQARGMPMARYNDNK
jgi:hypothetical protein